VRLCSPTIFNAKLASLTFRRKSGNWDDRGLGM